MARIAPALLAADFAHLGEALRVVEAAGGQTVHLDVADGHFAGEITLGLPVLESVRRATSLALEVHLLVERPERFLSSFVRAGADRVAVHPASTSHLWRPLEVIRGCGAQAGVALDIGTPLETVPDFFDGLDFLAVLGTDLDFKPGVHGAAANWRFAPAALHKLRQALKLREERGARFELEAEGGVDLQNFDELVGAGADILVSDFAIFETSDSVSKLSELIRRAARPARIRPASESPAEKDSPERS